MSVLVASLVSGTLIWAAFMIGYTAGEHRAWTRELVQKERDARRLVRAVELHQNPEFAARLAGQPGALREHAMWN